MPAIPSVPPLPNSSKSGASAPVRKSSVIPKAPILAAVAFDAAKAAVARKADVLILDTAGRLHTKVNLMEELKKVRRVVDREIPGRSP